MILKQRFTIKTELTRFELEMNSQNLEGVMVDISIIIYVELFSFTKGIKLITFV